MNYVEALAWFKLWRSSSDILLRARKYPFHSHQFNHQVSYNFSDFSFNRETRIKSSHQSHDFLLNSHDFRHCISLFFLFNLISCLHNCITNEIIIIKQKPVRSVNSAFGLNIELLSNFACTSFENLRLKELKCNLVPRLFQNRLEQNIPYQNTALYSNNELSYTNSPSSDYHETNSYCTIVYCIYVRGESHSQ